MQVVFVYTGGDMCDLTFGKSYKVESMCKNTNNLHMWGDITYIVIDDGGIDAWLTEPFVMLESKWRKIKLEKLNSLCE